MNLKVSAHMGTCHRVTSQQHVEARKSCVVHTEGRGAGTCSSNKITMCTHPKKCRDRDMSFFFDFFKILLFAKHVITDTTIKLLTSQEIIYYTIFTPLTILQFTILSLSVSPSPSLPFSLSLSLTHLQEFKNTPFEPYIHVYVYQISLDIIILFILSISF